MLPDFVNVDLRVRDQLTVKPDLAACRRFQKIQAAQKGTFAWTGGTHDNDLFSLMDMIAHSAQYMIMLKFFMQVFNDYHSYAASSPVCPVKWSVF